MSIKVTITKKLSQAFTLQTEFESGEGTLGILGASGSGKSMTLKCIAGVEEPDEGVISVNGRILFDKVRGRRASVNLRPQMRNVGYLFQNYALFPRMTLLDNISSGLSALSRDDRAEKVGRWIADFDLEGLEKRFPHQLSGGQQQRAALARMLARDPEAVLLDEPFSALDTSLREFMQLLEGCDRRIMEIRYSPPRCGILPSKGGSAL
jgi:molybdate transport system ATP-binding protein